MEKELEQQSQLDRIEKAATMAALTTKKVLTFNEAVSFTGLGKSHLYKLTSTSKIPHYKPRQKLLYFDREELEKWLLQNRVTTTDEIEAQADRYLSSTRKGGENNV